MIPSEKTNKNSLNLILIKFELLKKNFSFSKSQISKREIEIDSNLQQSIVMLSVYKNFNLKFQQNLLFCQNFKLKLSNRESLSV